MPTSLLNTLSQRLNAPPEVVERSLYVLVNKIRLQVASEGSALVPGLGTFRFFNGDLVFEPAEALSVAVNYRFSGLEPVTISPPVVPQQKQVVPALAREDEVIKKEKSKAAPAVSAIHSATAGSAWTDTAKEEYPSIPEEEHVPPAQQEKEQELVSTDTVSPTVSTSIQSPEDETVEEPRVDVAPDAGEEQEAVLDAAEDREEFIVEEERLSTEVKVEADTEQVQEETEEVEFVLPEEEVVETHPQESAEPVESTTLEETPVPISETSEEADLTPAESPDEEPVAPLPITETLWEEDLTPKKSSSEEVIPPVPVETEPVAVRSPEIQKERPSVPPPGRVPEQDTRPAKRRSPLVLVGSLALVALVVAALLFFLMRSEEPSVITPVEQQPPALAADTATTLRTDTTSLAVLPQAQSQVPVENEVEEPTSETPEDVFNAPLRSEGGVNVDAGGFSLVVASRTGSDAAETVAESYRDQGFRTSVLHGPYQDVTRYRVVVGQFRNETEAFSALRDQTNGFPEDAWVLPLSKNLEAQD